MLTSFLSTQSIEITFPPILQILMNSRTKIYVFQLKKVKRAPSFVPQNISLTSNWILFAAKLSHDDLQAHSELENQYDIEPREDPQRFNQLQATTNNDLRTFQQVQVQVKMPPTELSENLMDNQEPVNQSSETLVLPIQNQIQCEPQIQNNSRKSDECEIFGNFVAEVMRNMTKPQSRKLQTKILGLIADCEDNN